MKDQYRILAIVIGVIILVAELAYSKDEYVPVCDPEDSLIKQHTGMKIQLSELPKATLVARESVQEIHSKKSMIMSRQSFKKAQAKVECAKFDQGYHVQNSVVLPVLIDLTNEQKTQNSYWQFHSMVKNNKIGIWNQKTKVVQQNLSLAEWAQKQNAEIDFFQIQHDQYVLQLRQKTEDATIIQRIFYDVSDE